MSVPFRTRQSIAVPLLIDNIDTDQIIPSREMKTVSRTGLGDGLFASWRYLSVTDRTPDRTFVLNRDEYAGATILLSGANFGCGSSREHAVWALQDYGIEVVIALSFGEIFYGNCLRNGVLPISLISDEIEFFRQQSAAIPPRPVHVDLPKQTLTCAQRVFKFDIDPYGKRLLVEGLDPIGLTLQQADKIARFQTADKASRPWLYNSDTRPA